MKRLNEDVKNLMHMVMDGNLNLVAIMHQLHRYKDHKIILTWLIRNRIMGNNLVDWLKINHDNSVLGMVKEIVRRHNKEATEKSMILGKDWN